MAKNGVINPKKDKKEKKDPFEKKRERERSSFNRNAFISFLIPANFNQRTSLVQTRPLYKLVAIFVLDILNSVA